jgi:hypothetical protein
VRGIRHLILCTGNGNVDNSQVDSLDMFGKMVLPELVSVELHINRLSSLADLRLVCPA